MVVDGMTNCPECASAQTEIILTMHDDRQDERLTTITKHKCLDCGCEFEVVEQWAIQVTKHGKEPAE